MTKYNRRIVIRAWSTERNAIGGPEAVEVGAWETWAGVEDRRGSNSAPAMQTLWDYDYKVTFRYYKSRQVGSNYTIDYDGLRLKINSLSINKEAFHHEYIARCSTVDGYVASAPGGAVIPLPQIRSYKTTPTGSGFTASAVAGKQVIGAYKDGQWFDIVTVLSGDATKKEVTISTAGVTVWSVPFDGETATLQYIN